MRSIAAVKSASDDGVGAAARREQRRLVDQVGEVGAGEARRQRGDLLRDRRRARASPCCRCTCRICDAAELVGPIDQHLAIEAAGAQQRRVEDLGPVGGGEQDQSRRVGSKPSSSTRSWFKRLLLLVVAADAGYAPRARPSASSSSMKMMPGALCARLLEQIAHARRADADEHLDELRAVDREERHAGFARDRAREQRLAGARRARPAARPSGMRAPSRP